MIYTLQIYSFLRKKQKKKRNSLAVSEIFHIFAANLPTGNNQYRTMNYQETCDWLFSQTANFEHQGASGYKPGLETSLALDEHYGHPHRSFRSIHVAGTNGKGSVSHLLAAQMQGCGYCVGLYTSPHLLDFSERIRVNGKPITEDYVVKFVEEGKPLFDRLKCSFFEIATAMAFSYFRDKDVDMAIVEVGLGGRLDCTNIITPIVSVITNVSLDHTQLLGGTVEQIAMEKGGIIKRGVPVVIGEATEQTRPVFEALAKEAGAPIVFAEDEQEVTAWQPTPDGLMHYTTKHLGEFNCELVGDYQPRNMNTVVAAQHQLANMGYLADRSKPGNRQNIEKELDRAYSNVVNSTGLKGRWQRIRTSPTVVCDTGHNPGAWEYLSRQLKAVKCRQLRIVFGMVEDKDVYTVMSLLPSEATYFFTKGSTKRAMPETSLKVFAEQFGLKGSCYPTVAEAFKAAIEGATSDDFIFVGGSFYVVADFMRSRM